MPGPLISRTLFLNDLVSEQFPGTDRYVRTVGNDGNDGLSFATAKRTIQAAVDAASAGDRILIGGGSYDEQVTVGKSLTIIGRGPRGNIGIAPSGSNKTALTVTGSGVTLINVGCEGDGTGGGVLVNGNIRRFRAQGCKFEGGAFAVKLDGAAAGVSVADTRFEDCEFAWTAVGLLLAASGGADPVTQTLVTRSVFHNNTAACVKVDTVHSADLWLTENVFGNNEDASEPTDYVLADVANTTGFISGNYFADTAHVAAKITLAAGVLYSGNFAESGVNTARPA